jgi:micrococcal nuclease
LPRLSEKELREKRDNIYFVRKVIDGDTFEIDLKDDKGKYYRVRMLGIDTPEKFESDKLNRDVNRTKQDKKTLQKLGELASEFTQNLIEGKNVHLVPEKNYEDKDKYGRLLRYVYLEDGTFVNKKIIEDGYAYAYRRFNISRLDEFIKAEKTARETRRGLWGEVEGLKQFNENKENKTDSIPDKRKEKKR